MENEKIDLRKAQIIKIGLGFEGELISEIENLKEIVLQSKHFERKLPIDLAKNTKDLIILGDFYNMIFNYEFGFKKILLQTNDIVAITKELITHAISHNNLKAAYYLANPNLMVGAYHINDYSIFADQITKMLDEAEIDYIANEIRQRSNQMKRRNSDISYSPSEKENTIESPNKYQMLDSPDATLLRPEGIEYPEHYMKQIHAVTHAESIIIGMIKEYMTNAEPYVNIEELDETTYAKQFYYFIDTNDIKKCCQFIQFIDIYQHRINTPLLLSDLSEYALHNNRLKICYLIANPTLKIQGYLNSNICKPYVTEWIEFKISEIAQAHNEIRFLYDDEAQQTSTICKSPAIQNISELMQNDTTYREY